MCEVQVGAGGLSSLLTSTSLNVRAVSGNYRDDQHEASLRRVSFCNAISLGDHPSSFGSLRFCVHALPERCRRLACSTSF